MKPLSRREFLRLAAAGSAGVGVSSLLAACGVEEELLTPTGLPTQPPTTTSTTTPISTATQNPTASPTDEPTATQTPVPIPDLVVARNGEPEVLVRRALAALGGMEKFVWKGADVIVKPNICVGYRTYKYAATTNPWVVGAIVKLCFEAGAKRVRVMDHTWRREMWEGYAKSGIQEQVQAAGGEMEWMPVEKFVPTPIPQGLDVTSLDLYEDVLNTDVLINVPIAKHHADARLTLGMKNLMGVMDDRLTMHTNMGQRLADLNSRVRPTLNIMDAVRMLMAYGPTGGALSDVKQMDTVIVSRDVVALDSYTATLFDMQPTDLEYIKAATAMGLGRSDLDNLRIEEINIS